MKYIYNLFFLFSQMKKIFYGILINFFFTFITFFYTSYLLRLDLINNLTYFFELLLIIFLSRQFISFLLFDDFKLSWSKASIWTAYLKFFNNTISFLIYFSIFKLLDYDVPLNLLLFEYSNFLFLLAICIYTYRYYKIGSIKNIKNDIIIYGAGKAGLSVKNELNHISNILFFIDDDKKMHFRSIDGLSIFSSKKASRFLFNNNENNISLIIAIPSGKKEKIIKIYNTFKPIIKDIKVLPPSSIRYHDKPYSQQLKKISIIDLLARTPKGLDENLILNFIKDKVVLITGSSGTIGSELLNLSIKYKAKKILAIDHNEYGQYLLNEKKHKNVLSFVVSVINKDLINKIFAKHKPDIVIHAAAYKHVHISEYIPSSVILNNVLGTKNLVDISIQNEVKKFILISTDKAVRPTNIMGASKSIAELYCQNVKSELTDVISVRFGNVLNSSGSVIPKFKKQIKNNLDLTVTHKDITRYFMLVDEACKLVLQSSAIGKNGEVLILDMGNPIKIDELAKKMISLSGKNLKVKYTGLRKGEKLFEELLFNKTDKKTKYDSITIAKKRNYNIKSLNKEIEILLKTENKKELIFLINKILPDFNHLRDNDSTLSEKNLKELGLIN